MSESLARSGLYASIKQSTPGADWDCIVIGSGIGGMACGAALAKHGQRVLLLEQHYVPGGMTHTFTRHGFRWDVGVHCLGEQGPKDVSGKLLHWLTDGQIRMNRLPEVYERFWFPGRQYTYSSNIENHQATLIRAFPKEEAAIRKYFRLVRWVFNMARPFYVLKAAPLPVNRVANAAMGGLWKRYWQRTTKEVLDELFSDDKLKAVLVAQWGYYGSPPSRSSFGMHAMVARHFFDGAFYPVGGSEAFAKYLLATINEAGGRTYVRASVDEILVEHGSAVGVRLSGGECIRAKRVVSAVGAKNTINRLLPEAHRSSSWARSLNGLSSSPAYLCLNLGFEGDIRKAGASETNNWLMQSWDVEDSHWNFSDPKAVPPIAYLSFPSLKDPELKERCHERSTGEALAFVHWEEFAAWADTRRGHRGADYEALKQELADRFVAHLRDQLPDIMKHLVYYEMSTPVSTHFFTRSWEGGIYSFETTPERFANTDLSAHTPIKNLYLTGSDVISPGVAGALVAGVLTAAAIDPRVALKLA